MLPEKVRRLQIQKRFAVDITTLRRIATLKGVELERSLLTKLNIEASLASAIGMVFDSSCATSTRKFLADKYLPIDLDEDLGTWGMNLDAVSGIVIMALSNPGVVQKILFYTELFGEDIAHDIASTIMLNLVDYEVVAVFDKYNLPGTTFFSVTAKK